MSDSSIDKILHYGTAVERAAFTPAPATGAQILYWWLDTDNLPTVELFVWDPVGMGWEPLPVGSLADGDYGSVTVSGGGTVITIDNAAVTYAKIQNVADGKVLGNFSGGAAAPSEYGLSSGLEQNSSNLRVKASTRTRTITFVFDGGGAEIADNVYATYRIPVAGTLTGWTILAKQSGAIKIDVWKDTFANNPPTNADSITNGHEPEIPASGSSAEDTNITDWMSTAVTAGDVITASVDSCTTIQWAVLILTMTETG